MLVTPTVAFVRKTNLLTDTVVQHYMAAQQVQIERDFFPVWGSTAKCIFIPKGHTIPKGVWQCLLMDKSDVPDAGGYHYTTPDGHPIMRVFVGDAMRDGLAWSVTASHEVLETLADPWIDNTVPVTLGGVSYQFAREICDTCEDDSNAYPINGVFMTDFAYPAWFDPDGKAPFTHRNAVHAPLALAEGGYIGVREVAPVPGDWTQRFADGVPTARMVKGPSSRTMRRFVAQSVDAETFVA